MMWQYTRRYTCKCNSTFRKMKFLLLNNLNVDESSFNSYDIYKSYNKIF